MISCKFEASLVYIGNSRTPKVEKNYLKKQTEEEEEKP